MSNEHLPRAEGLAGAEERFLLDLDENINMLSMLVEEGKEQMETKDVYAVSCSTSSVQELSSSLCPGGGVSNRPPGENVSQVSTSKAKHSTSLPYMKSSTTTYKMKKGGKRSILNYAVKKNLNFSSPKPKSTKPVAKPRTLPVYILPKCVEGGHHSGQGEVTGRESGGRQHS